MAASFPAKRSLAARDGILTRRNCSIPRLQSAAKAGCHPTIIGPRHSLNSPALAHTHATLRRSGSGGTFPTPPKQNAPSAFCAFKSLLNSEKGKFMEIIW